MEELARRRMLWIALVASAGFFVVTLLLAATGTLNAGWYLVGATVYGGIFVLAIVGFVTERVPATAAPPAPMPSVVLPAPTNGGATTDVYRERVIYSTRSGQVLEMQHRGAEGDARDFDVITGSEAVPLGAIEGDIDARGWPAGPEPSEPELRSALQRWGRIHGGT